MAAHVHDLGEHRLTAIDPVRIVSTYAHPVGRNAFREHHGSGGESIALRLSTDAGATGWGLPLGSTAEIGALIGRRVGDLIDPAVGVVDAAALPLDIALHDLAGRILGLPVHVMLGSSGPTDLPAYSGAVYFDDLDAEPGRELDAIRETLRIDAALGYRDFKLKIGRGHRWMPHAEGLERDIQVTRLARECHPEADLLVDANDGYSPTTLFEYLDAVGDCSLTWVEEPFAERIEDLRLLRSYLDGLGSRTLVADGEYEPNERQVFRLASEGLIDVALMDVIGYGFTAWRRAMPRLMASGTRASPHAWGTPLKTLYAAQLGAGLGNVLTIEGVPGSTDGADTSGYRLEDGLLHVPDEPGFGIPLTP